MGNSGVIQLHSLEESKAQLGICSGCLGPGNLDRGEFAIYKTLGVPRGKIIPSAMIHLSQNEVQFMNAGRGKNLSAIRWYISQGLSANTLDENRTSILHIACRDGSFQIVEELVNCNANLNLADVGGWTALHIASHCGRSRIWSLLLQSGADAFAKTNRDETPYDLARNEDTIYVFDLYWKERENSLKSQDPVPDKIEQFRLAKQQIEPEAQKVRRIREQDSPPLFPNSKVKTSSEWISPLLESGSYVVTHPTRPIDMQIGVAIFNISPLKGISYMILTGVVENDPIEISELLHLVPDLSPVGIGEILGCSEFGFRDVAKYYLQRISLRDVDIVDALHKILTHFQFPLNGQMADQIFSTFSQIYFQQNVNDTIFANPYAIQMLSFSVIMLDNSLHDSLGSQMSQEHFVSSNAAMNDGSDFDPDFLVGVYNRIQAKSIRTRHNRPVAMNLRAAGTINGQLERRKGQSWKPGHYVLSDHCLYYFSAHNATTPCGFIPLDQIIIIGQDKNTFVLKAREEGQNVLVVKMSDNGAIKYKRELEIIFRSNELKKWCKII